MRGWLIVIKNIWVFSCDKGNEHLYDLYCFRGHFFRVNNDGTISAADDGDIKTADKFRDFARKHGVIY
jgi:hypothetical protein